MGCTLAWLLPLRVPVAGSLLKTDWGTGGGGGRAAIDTGSLARVERGEGLVSRSGPTALNDPGERERELAPTEISPPPPLLCEKRGEERVNLTPPSPPAITPLFGL